MRVAVVGATGNTGTAVLIALQQRPEVDSILGIARRMPDESVEPYSGAEWATIDIGAANDPDDATAQLAEAFTGVDAVIHLAWLIQPNSRRELLRRVNVEGTRHVSRAVAAAGVRQLVVASSVGAYSPSHGDEPRDERWPTHGIPTSHYSVDKAAQERVLDAFATHHPDIVVTRLRPALTFQGRASSEIQRYFLGSWIPVQALRVGRPPVLPVPKGLRIQAVHAEDVGAAYAAAAVRRARGAFNISADDVLRPQQLADIVDHGRFIEVPSKLLRPALVAGHRTGLVAADSGWLDMGMSVPVMDNSRAKAELDWQPRYSGADALAELLDGMISGRGVDSVPMRPRDTRQARIPVGDEPAGVGAMADADATADTPDEHAGRRPRISPEISTDLLGLYLSDHLTGATAGADRIARMAEVYVDTPMYAELSVIADEIRTERTFIEQLIHDLGLKQLPHRQAIAWAGEHIGRLKNNGRLFTRSPMTLVLETELMRSAVTGKRGSWQTLCDNAEQLGLDPRVFAELSENALRQAEVLERVHEYARRRAFHEDRKTFERHRGR